MLKHKQKAKIIISKALEDKSALLHRRIGRLEWSGILLYSIEEGDISNPETLVVKAQDFYLMDVGSHSYTEYDLGPEVMNMYDKFPQADPFECENGVLPWKTGHIHTHHAMETSFSVTDNKELENNSPKHNYYLSLIVNFQGSYNAVIAIAMEVENKNTYKYKGSNGKPIGFTSTKMEKEVVIIECDIEYAEIGIEKELEGRILFLKTQKEEKRKEELKNFASERFKKKNRGIAPKSKNSDHISDHQKYLRFNDELDETRIKKYIASVIMIQKNTSKAIYQALMEVEHMTDTEYVQWKQQVDSQIYQMFCAMFPETTLTVYDIIDSCIDILSIYQSSEAAKDVIYLFRSWSDLDDDQKEWITTHEEIIP